MADYQSRWAEFKQERIGLLAASVDPEDKANEVILKLGLTLPIGFGLDAEAFSRATGAFYQAERKFLHATAFLLKPGGKLELASYSTGSIGRMTAGDVLTLVRYYRSLQKK